MELTKTQEVLKEILIEYLKKATADGADLKDKENIVGVANILLRF